jgi:hypothetical protein
MSVSLAPRDAAFELRSNSSPAVKILQNYAELGCGGLKPLPVRVVAPREHLAHGRRTILAICLFGEYAHFKHIHLLVSWSTSISRLINWYINLQVFRSTALIKVISKSSLILVCVALVS